MVNESIRNRISAYVEKALTLDGHKNAQEAAKKLKKELYTIRNTIVHGGFRKVQLNGTADGYYEQLRAITESTLMATIKHHQILQADN
jgi:bisphosphoglycerate-dependent phosphoglycerate mutase